MADLNTTEMMTLCTTVAKGSGSKSSEEYQDTDQAYRETAKELFPNQDVMQIVIFLAHLAFKYLFSSTCLSPSSSQLLPPIVNALFSLFCLCVQFKLTMQALHIYSTLCFCLFFTIKNMRWPTYLLGAYKQSH